MIIAVTENYHDYQAQSYLLDTDKLNPANYVDSKILKSIQTNKTIVSVRIDATNWESMPEFGGVEPSVTAAAKLKTKKLPAEKTLNLTIYFDC